MPPADAGGPAPQSLSFPVSVGLAHQAVQVENQLVQSTSLASAINPLPRHVHQELQLLPAHQNRRLSFSPSSSPCLCVSVVQFLWFWPKASLRALRLCVRSSLRPLPPSRPPSLSPSPPPCLRVSVVKHQEQPSHPRPTTDN